MSDREMRQRADAVVRQAVREKGLVRTQKAMECVPDVLECVSVDRERLVREMRAKLSGGSNPVSALLELIGLRLVRRDRAVRCLEDMLSDPGEGEADIALEAAEGSGPAWLLTADEDRLQRAAQKLADVLLECEEAQRRQARQAQEARAGASDEANRLRQALTEAEGERDALRLTAARGIQSLLARTGPEGPLAGQIGDMMEDLELAACWPGDGNAPQGAFTTLRCDDPASRRCKPCMVHEGKALVKGLQYETAQ